MGGVVTLTLPLRCPVTGDLALGLEGELTPAQDPGFPFCPIAPAPLVLNSSVRQDRDHTPDGVPIRQVALADLYALAREGHTSIPSARLPGAQESRDLDPKWRQSLSNELERRLRVGRGIGGHADGGGGPLNEFVEEIRLEGRDDALPPQSVEDLDDIASVGSTCRHLTSSPTLRYLSPTSSRRGPRVRLWTGRSAHHGSLLSSRLLEQNQCGVRIGSARQA